MSSFGIALAPTSMECWTSRTSLTSLHATQSQTICLARRNDHIDACTVFRLNCMSIKDVLLFFDSHVSRTCTRNARPHASLQSAESLVVTGKSKQCCALLQLTPTVITLVFKLKYDRCKRTCPYVLLKQCRLKRWLKAQLRIRNGIASWRAPPNCTA